MQQPSTTISLTLTPEQIRRRVVDFDVQIRQGLDEGNIRNVMKRIGVSMVSHFFCKELPLY